MSAGTCTVGQFGYLEDQVPFMQGAGFLFQCDCGSAIADGQEQIGFSRSPSASSARVHPCAISTICVG